MVNREWFSAASKVFYSRTNFFLRHNDDFDNQMEGPAQDQQIKEFIADDGVPRPYARFITTMTVLLESTRTAATVVDMVKLCPALKHLHFRITGGYFADDEWEDSSIRHTLWTPFELREHDSTLPRLRGIHDLTIELGESKFYESGGETYLDNLKTLHELIKPFAYQPRPEDWCNLDSLEETEGEGETEDEENSDGNDEPKGNDGTAPRSSAPANNRPTTGSNDEEGLSPWQKLPQEIKDIIFEMAYVSDRQCTPFHKSTWRPVTCHCDHHMNCGARGHENVQVRLSPHFDMRPFF